MSAIPGFWLQSRHPAARALAPVGWLFCALAALRRRCLTAAAGDGAALPPVVVVGSIFVGGTGKTPMVIALVALARDLDLHPGIVLRGYGGRARGGPLLVSPDSDPAAVGDEAVLLARRAGCPVVASRARVAGVERLAQQGCTLVISDDGLQHYRMPRAAEIVVLDAQRGLGNGRCMPAGPLREPPERLAEVDMVIGNGGPTAVGGDWFSLRAGALEPIAGDRAAARLPDAGSRIHAVAGIGDPERFFRSLEGAGYVVERHPFPDHHTYRPADLAFGDDLAIIMTEKDAVKCAAFAPAGTYWLPVEAVPEAATAGRLRSLLVRAARPTGVTGH